MTNKSKSLTFRDNKTIGDETIFIKIQLADECKNGHQDFSITGDIYEAGKPKVDRYFIAGGCIHDEILKHFPEFKIFIGLHLCDWEGVPMYAAGNGFYHLKNGFNNTKPDTDSFAPEFCEYYRITKKQFAILSTSKNELQFAVKIQELGILKQWKEEANKAIAILEVLTGETFEPASRKSNFIAPTAEALEEEKQKQESGYYTEEAAAAREQEKINKKLDKMLEEADNKIANIKLELLIQKRLLLLGGERFLDNCIFYNHSKELKINWRGYGEPLTEKEIKKIKNELVLPAGIDYSKEV